MKREEPFQSTELWGRGREGGSCFNLLRYGAREEDGSHGGIALLEGEERLSSSHAKPRGFTRELQ